MSVCLCVYVCVDRLYFFTVYFLNILDYSRCIRAVNRRHNSTHYRSEMVPPSRGRLNGWAQVKTGPTDLSSHLFRAPSMKNSIMTSRSTQIDHEQASERTNERERERKRKSKNYFYQIIEEERKRKTGFYFFFVVKRLEGMSHEHLLRALRYNNVRIRH